MVWPPSVFSVKMDIFALLVLAVVVFVLVYVCAFFFVDCDLGLVWAEKFGKPIGKLRTVIVTLQLLCKQKHSYGVCFLL